MHGLFKYAVGTVSIKRSVK